MAKYKIENDAPDDFFLLGIAAPLREYKLCYLLNELLKVDFEMLNDLVFEAKDRGRKIRFCVFRAESADDKQQFHVFCNRDMGELLLPELSGFDFVLQVKGIDESDAKALAEGIRTLPDVVIASFVPLKKVKSLARLTYQEETTTQRLFSKRLK